MSRNHTLENQLELAIKNSQWNNKEEITQDKVARIQQGFSDALKSFAKSKDSIFKKIGLASTTIRYLKDIEKELKNLIKVFKSGDDLQDEKKLKKIKATAAKVAKKADAAAKKADKLKTDKNAKGDKYKEKAIEGLEDSLDILKREFDMFANLEVAKG